MQNYMAAIEYDGSDYSGFQSQPGNTKTIQGELLRVLNLILNEKIKIQYSGRTDTGVHAKEQVINFKTIRELDLFRFKWSVNSLLPSDIVLKNIKPVNINFNSRRDAKLREYCYYVVNDNYQSVFLKKYSILVTRKLNVGLMKKAAELFIGKKDFRSFCHESCDEKNKVREVYDFSVEKDEDNIITFKVSANSFLYHMVRVIVSALIDVGSGKKDLTEIDKGLAGENKDFIKKLAPAKGLFLNRVIY